jgi:hypothetical protein
MNYIRPQYHFRNSDKGLLAWDVRRLIRLSKALETKHVKLENICELDTEFWYEIGGTRPTCRNILEHTKLINEVNLKYPIILCKNGKIMDGMHRVCKALLLKRESILAVKFEEDIIPDFVGVNPGDLPYD